MCKIPSSVDRDSRRTYDASTVASKSAPHPAADLEEHAVQELARLKMDPFGDKKEHHGAQSAGILESDPPTALRTRDDEGYLERPHSPAEPNGGLPTEPEPVASQPVEEVQPEQDEEADENPAVLDDLVNLLLSMSPLSSDSSDSLLSDGSSLSEESFDESAPSPSSANPECANATLAFVRESSTTSLDIGQPPAPATPLSSDDQAACVVDAMLNEARRVAERSKIDLRRLLKQELEERQDTLSAEERSRIRIRRETVVSRQNQVVYTSELEGLVRGLVSQSLNLFDDLNS